MKTLTNYTAGARGINLQDGSTRWIEPGETVESSTTVSWVKWLHEQVAVVSDVPVRVQPASEYVSEAVSQYTQRSRARLFVFCSGQATS